jgi:hypothetical protein
MARIRFNGEMVTVWQSEQFALPPGVDELELSIADLIFILKFVGSEEKTPEVSMQVTAGTSMTINFQNFHNPLGTAFDATVGTLNGKPLRICVVVGTLFGAESPARSVSVTFFEGLAA